MKTVLILSLVVGGVLPASADDTKIRQAIEKGIVTGQFLQTLTPDDVPDKWKVREETKEKDTYTTRTYSRGGVKVLTVLWSKNPKPGMEKLFTAVLYHGDERVASVTHLSDSTTVLPTGASEEYKVFTTVKEDGTVSVMVVQNDNGFFESIVVKGHDTHPIDDLDYTKAALGMESIVRPLIESIQEGLDAKPKPSPNK